MKILVVGSWHSELHEEPVYQALKTLGHDTSRFSWVEYFNVNNSHFLLSSIVKNYKKFQNKYKIGPLLQKINFDLVKCVKQNRPDLIFFYRGTHVFSETLREIKDMYPSTFLIGYNNDDPFSKDHHWGLWRHFLKSIRYYDMVLAYRPHNLDELRKSGAKEVSLLRSWFVPTRNYPVKLSAEEHARFDCDVLFAGHYEPDGRLKILEETVRQGFKLRLFGPGYDWDPVIRNSKWLKHLMPVQLVWGEDYNKAICGAKIALCFLSKMNRDTYTRRCFEIPASGTFMLSEYTSDLAEMFKEGVEAEFFRSKEELIQKIQYYTENEAARNAIAEAGYKRVITDGHDVVSRMSYVIHLVESQKNCNYFRPPGEKGMYD